MLMSERIVELEEQLSTVTVEKELLEKKTRELENRVRMCEGQLERVMTLADKYVKAEQLMNRMSDNVSKVEALLTQVTALEKRLAHCEVSDSTLNRLIQRVDEAGDKIINCKTTTDELEFLEERLKEMEYAIIPCGGNSGKVASIEKKLEALSKKIKVCEVKDTVVQKVADSVDMMEDDLLDNNGSFYTDRVIRSLCEAHVISETRVAEKVEELEKKIEFIRLGIECSK